MTSTLEKEETVLWKGKNLALKLFVKMVPNMTRTDIDNFLDNKKLVKRAADYLKSTPEERINK